MGAVAASPASAAPTNYYVDGGAGNDGNDCLSAVTACQTVQAAVDKASSGDTVNVAAGTYNEDVVSAKSLTFLGANAGTPGNGARGAESTLKTLRTAAGGAGTTPYDITIDGFAFDPQSDATLLGGTVPMVFLRGGSGAGTTFTNNVLSGGASFIPGCASPDADNCGMAHTGLRVLGGVTDVSLNVVQNFRYGVRLSQEFSSPSLTANVDSNVVTGVSVQGVAIGSTNGLQQPGATVANNDISATGATSSPAGVLILNGGNSVTSNTFTDLGSGVFISLCKRYNTTGNTVDDNAFVRTALTIDVNLTSGCTVGSGSDTEGTGSWVSGGGRFDGFNANGNSFTGTGSRLFSNSATGWFPGKTPVTNGPIDVSCNWWGDPSGPSTPANPTGTGRPLTYSTTANQPAFGFTSWESSDGGACDGTAPNAPRVRLGEAQALELQSGARGLFVPVFLSEPAAAPTTIAFYTSDGTAVGGQDYTVWGTPTNNRTITIPAGKVQSTINVPILSDNDPGDEPTEDFFVNVTSVAGSTAVLDPIASSGTGVILDPDSVGSPLPVVAVSSGSVWEGNSGTRVAQFYVNLDKAPASNIVFTYVTADGTAVAPGDYTAKLPGTITFAPGQISKTIDVVIPSDTNPETFAKDFFLNVTITGGSPVDEFNPPLSGQMTILDDD